MSAIDDLAGRSLETLLTALPAVVGLVAIAYLADRLLGTRVSPRLRLGLHGLAIVLSILVLLPILSEPGPLDGAPPLPVLEHTTSDVGAESIAPVPAIAAAPSTAPSGIPLAVALWMAAVYAAVALLLLVGYARGKLRLWQVVRSSVAHDLFEGVAVRLHDSEGPFACGLFRPCIVLPRSLATGVSGEELQLLLRHERAHHRHGDVWINEMLMLLSALLWVVVPLWLSIRRMRTLMEISADEAAVAGVRSRRRYGEFLLQLAQSGEPPARASLSAVGRFSVLKERIGALATARRSRGVQACSAISAVGLLVACNLAAPQPEVEVVDGYDSTPPQESAASPAAPEEEEGEPEMTVEEATHCGQNAMDSFNRDPQATDAAETLIEGARCFERAGKLGLALYLNVTTVKRFPDTEQAALAREGKKRMYRLMSDPDAAVGSPVEAECLAAMGDTGDQHAAVAECFYKRGYIAVALSHFKRARALGGLSEEAETEKRIIKIESNLESFSEKL